MRDELEAGVRGVVAFALRVDSLAILMGCGTGLLLGLVGAIPPAMKAMQYAIVEGLKAIPGVVRIDMIPRDQAWAEYRAKSPDKDVFEGFNENPFPDKFVVAAATPELSLQIADRLRQMPQIDKVNDGKARTRHDVLTGSDSQGRAFEMSDDTTCRNWTSSSTGNAMLGHMDRRGLADNPPNKSWNQSHMSAGCSQDALIGTGGNGYFMCFAAD